MRGEELTAQDAFHQLGLRGQRERGVATLPWIIATAVAGLLAGPRIRAGVPARSTGSGQPPSRDCPECSGQVLPDRWRWRPVLPVTGRCPARRTRIGPYPLLAGLAPAIMAARATSSWALAALAWLACWPLLPSLARSAAFDRWVRDHWPCP